MSKVNECIHILGLAEDRYDNTSTSKFLYTEEGVHYVRSKEDCVNKEDVIKKFNYCPDCGERVNKEG